MVKPSFVVDVDVSNLEAAIATLVLTLNKLNGTMEELKTVLEQIRLGTGLNIGVDLSKEEGK